MITRDRMEEIIKGLKSIDIQVAFESVEVDRDYITKLLGQCDDYTQKLEEWIIEVAFAVTQLENEVEEKKDFYDASFQEVMTTDVDVRNLGTGAERLNAAKHKLRDQTKEILKLQGECRELTTLKNVLERKVAHITKTISAGKKQYDVRMDSMKHNYLGARELVEIPGSVIEETSGLAEDESLTALSESESKIEESDFSTDL